MIPFKTPDSIIAELIEIREEAAKGIGALYDAECKVADAVLTLDTAEAKALLNADGKTMAERSAQAKLETAELELAKDLATAEYNRVRTKLRLLEQAQMSVQTQARMVELTYRNAGV